MLKFLNVSDNSGKRVFGLDLMRAIAIVIVVMGHGRMLESADTNFPWIKLPDGVELFFVLSGFLIGSILIKEFKAGSSGFRTLKKFWIRRWFRTLPNYYLVLVLNVLVVFFGFSDADITSFNWKFIVFVQNFYQPFTGFFWESWSLSIEEWFYILFPILLSMIFLVASHVKLSKNQVFLISIIIFLLIPLFLRVFIAADFHVDKFWLETSIYKVVIYRLDGIALGLLAALICHNFPQFWHKTRYVSLVAGIIIVYAVLYSTWQPDHFNTKVFKTILQSIGCFLMLPFFDQLRSAPRLLLKPVTHISLVSYSMYLLNLGLISSIITSNFIIQNKAFAWMLYGLYWFLVIVLSTLLYKHFEKPMMNMRDKFAPNEKAEPKVNAIKT